MSSQSFFATCPRGLEAPLAAELAACGAREIRTTGGGAHFRGDLAACYAANLESRIGTRILWRVAEAPYRTEQDVYEATHAQDWPARFRLDRSIRVDVNAIRSPLRPARGCYS